MRISRTFHKSQLQRVSCLTRPDRLTSHRTSFCAKLQLQLLCATYLTAVRWRHVVALTIATTAAVRQPRACSRNQVTPSFLRERSLLWLCPAMWSVVI